MTGRSGIGVVLVLAAMVWLGARGDDWSHAYELKGRQTHYYSLLAHGLLKGQLSLDQAVDPALLSADPKVHAQATYLLDASLYHGKYFIYFGVVPALLLFLPYTALTGQDLPENAAVLLMVAAGFLVYALAYRTIQRRYLPGLSPVLRACSLLLLAFGAVTPVLLVHGDFYGVPIAGGYLCLAVVWLGLIRAWHSERRTGAWLALAGTAAGLAVGCRPNYLTVFPVLALAGFLIVRRRVSPGILAAAAVAPAAVIGALLMAYNDARFDSPWEFGIHYQLTAMLGTTMPLSRASFFWSNLRWYYLRSPALSVYFPYAFPMNLGARPVDYYGHGVMEGQLVAALFLLGCGAWLASRWRAGSPWPPFLRSLLPLLLAAFAGEFLGVAFIGFTADRYEVDFQATLVLFLAVAGGACAQDDVVGRWSRARRAAFACLAGATALFNLLISFQLLDHFEHSRPASFHRLARAGDFPARLLARAGLLRFGPVRFKLVFAAVDHDTDWPLVATGVPNYNDVFYVNQLPNGTAQFGVNHKGYGVVTSERFPIELGRSYEVEADLGSLYPPRRDPYFDGWEEREVDRLKTIAVAKLDGKNLLTQRIKFFDGPADWVYLGRNPAGDDEPFNGRILSPQRLAPPNRASLGTLFEPGVWRLSLTFRPSAAGQPVLGSGFSGHGNLLFVSVLPDQTVRFESDQWGLGLDRSPPIKLGSASPHLLEFFVGPQVARLKLPDGSQPEAGAMADSAGLLRVWLDGAPVWTDPLYVNLDSYD